MNNAHPLVSIIIALFNAEKYIADAVNSIRNQTYSNIEIVIVNDGSTDGSVAEVEKIIKLDSRIRLYHQANKGQCAASNLGFNKSKGLYIKFFDADDLLSKNTVEEQVKTLMGCNEFDVSFIDYIRFYDDDLSTVNRYQLPQLINYDCTPLEYIKFHGSPQIYSNALWLFHREIFKYTGLWDERLSLFNDTEFFPRVLQHVKKLYYTPGCKLYYRTNFKSGSLSQIISYTRMKSAVMATDLMAGYLREMESSDLVESLIAQSYVNLLEMAYPAQPIWTKILERRLKKFSVHQYKYSSSGSLYNLVLKIAGWKFARKIQAVYYKRRKISSYKS